MQDDQPFDARKLIADLGGARAVAQALGLSRTTPYRWLDRSGLSARTLARLKAAFPDLSVDQYFTTKDRDQRGDGTAKQDGS